MFCSLLKVIYRSHTLFKALADNSVHFLTWLFWALLSIDVYYNFGSMLAAFYWLCDKWVAYKDLKYFLIYSNYSSSWKLNSCKWIFFVSYFHLQPWRREWQPTLVFLPGEFHGRRNLAGYSPRGHKVTWLSDLTLSLSIWKVSRSSFLS